MKGFRRPAVAVVALFGVLAIAGSASAVVITFEDVQTPPTVYMSGQGFTASTVPVTISAFAPGASQCDIGTGGIAAGAGNELVLTNAVATFTFPGLTTGVSVQLGLPNANAQSVTVTVNNDTRTVSSVLALNNMYVDGAQLFVPFESPTGAAALIVIGDNIRQFAIGGQDVALDNLIASWNTPEPASLGLLGLAGIGLLRRRRA